jgi:hypothetical protein
MKDLCFYFYFYFIFFLRVICSRRRAVGACVGAFSSGKLVARARWTGWDCT